MNIPELLAPAGGMGSLRAAVHFGADAVYVGLKRFGLRAFAGNFDEEALREAADLVHSCGKRLYVTMNAYPYDDQMDSFLQAGRAARDAGADAAIVSDLGAVLELREKVPDLPVHISTQANTLNSRTVEFYASVGCERVILARELSLERIRKICGAVNGRIQLEAFVHGAACMSYSGRCMLSTALTGRSGNQGACAQPCRWKYAVVEEKRPGQYIPVSQDQNGTYIFSAKDLNLMPLLPELCSSGLSSLKIEGRMKTPYYVATVTAAYRKALNLLKDTPEAFEDSLPPLLDELRCASHRAWDTGFLRGVPEMHGDVDGCRQSREFIAMVEEDAEQDKPARLRLKNRFYAGDRLELLTPDGVTPFEAPSFIREKTGEKMDTLGIAGEVILMKLPCKAAAGDIIRGPVRNHQAG